MNKNSIISEKEKTPVLTEMCKCISAGICIGLGAMMKCSVQNPILGAFLFSIGLLAVCMFNLTLYTGRVAYLDTYESIEEYLCKMLGYFIGNVAGTGIVSLLARGDMVFKATETVLVVEHTGVYTVFMNSILCGVFIYLAVEGYRRYRTRFEGTLCLVLCVMGFILTGGRHCIADSAYMLIGNCYPDLEMEGRILVAALGNGIGALLIRQLIK